MERKDLVFINERGASLDDVVCFAMMHGCKHGLGHENLPIINRISTTYSDLYRYGIQNYQYYFVSNGGRITTDENDIEANEFDTEWYVIEISLDHHYRIFDIEEQKEEEKKFKLITYNFTARVSNSITLAIPQDADEDRFETYASNHISDDFGSWYEEEMELDDWDVEGENLTAEDISVSDADNADAIDDFD